MLPDFFSVFFPKKMLLFFFTQGGVIDELVVQVCVLVEQNVDFMRANSWLGHHELVAYGRIH
jgi:hypothetical protein